MVSYAGNSQIRIFKLWTPIYNQLLEIFTPHVSLTELNSLTSVTQHETEIHGTHAFATPLFPSLFKIEARDFRGRVENEL